MAHQMLLMTALTVAPMLFTWGNFYNFLIAQSLSHIPQLPVDDVNILELMILTGFACLLTIINYISCRGHNIFGWFDKNFNVMKNNSMESANCRFFLK